jgi:hypothetical protein
MNAPLMASGAFTAEADAAGPYSAPAGIVVFADGEA